MENGTGKAVELLRREELLDKFGAANYVVLVGMLLVSAGIGVYYWWRGQNSQAEFLLAGRSMSTLPMAFSLIASFMSAITLLGVPAEVYTAGTQFTISILSYPAVMTTVAVCYLPVYDALDLTTSYQYLELRFSKPVRLIASALFCLQMVLYMVKY